jgi:hypothetical protein
VTVPIRTIGATPPAPPTMSSTVPAPPVNPALPPAPSVIVVDGTGIPVVPAYQPARHTGLGTLTAAVAATATAAAAANGSGALSVSPKPSQPFAPLFGTIGGSTATVKVGSGSVVIAAGFTGVGSPGAADASCTSVGTLTATVAIPTATASAAYSGSGTLSH